MPTQRVHAAFAAMGLLALGVVLSSSAADARIVCNDGFQKIRGDWLSTPYCNDEHLAEIGRWHGVKVTGAEIRANPARKYELCRLIGRSPPAIDYCPPDGSSGRHR